MNSWTITRKIAGGRVELELLTYRPEMTTFVIDKLGAVYGDIDDRSALYALTVPITMNLIIIDEARDEDEMTRLADYWENRPPNPVDDFKRFLLLVTGDLMAEWYEACAQVAETFMAAEEPDPEAASVANNE